MNVSKDYTTFYDLHQDAPWCTDVPKDFSIYYTKDVNMSGIDRLTKSEGAHMALDSWLWMWRQFRTTIYTSSPERSSALSNYVIDLQHVRRHGAWVLSAQHVSRPMSLRSLKKRPGIGRRTACGTRGLLQREAASAPLSEQPEWL